MTILKTIGNFLVPIKLLKISLFSVPYTVWFPFFKSSEIKVYFNIYKMNILDARIHQAMERPTLHTNQTGKIKNQDFRETPILHLYSGRLAYRYFHP